MSLTSLQGGKDSLLYAPELHTVRTSVHVPQPFQDDITVLMSQTFVGFNDLCTKAHNMDPLEQAPKSAKKVGRAGFTYSSHST